MKSKDSYLSDPVKPAPGLQVNYLGSDQPSMTLNFSRGAAHVLAQYYQVSRGCTAVVQCRR